MVAGIAFTAAMAAQQNGSVTGTVICGDTNAPARRAFVSLQPAQADRNPFPMPGDMLGARTDGEGAFTIADVKPGEYYVLAQYAGYISGRDYLFPGPFSAEVSGRHDPLPGFVRRVKVAAGSSMNVTVRLQRGGSISGRVTYSDGAPVANVGLTPKLKLSSGEFAHIPGGGAAQSDSAGNYRIDGLPDGSYVVLGGILGEMVTVAGGARLGGSGRIFFAGDGMRASKARLAVVAGAAEQSGVDLVIPVEGRRVRGSVVTPDGHRVSNGLVRLCPTGEPGFSLATPIDADGFFEFADLPRDTYTLRLEKGPPIEIRVADADVLDVKIPAGPVR